MAEETIYDVWGWPVEEECCRLGMSPCRGSVEVHCSPSGSGRADYWCARHYDEALERDYRLRRDFPDSPLPPAWFDPANAGERWDDDY